MKIGEYEQMMAYLTRPGFNDGGSSEVVEIDFGSAEDKAFQDMMKAYKYYLSTGGKKSLKDYMRMSTGAGKFRGGGREHFRATGGRVNLSDGTEKIVEPPKSMQVDTTTSNPIPDYDITDFRNDAEIFVLAYHNNTLPTADIADRLNVFAKKGVDAGTFTMEEAADAVKDLQLYVKDRARQQRLRDVVPEGIGTIKREEFKYGTVPGKGNSRIQYDPETQIYRKRVQETIDGKETGKYIYSEPGQSLEDFKKIKPVRSTGAIEATVKARQFVDDWTKSWFDNNLKNYGVRDFEVMIDDLANDWNTRLESGDAPKASAKFNLSTPKLKLPNITSGRDVTTKKGGIEPFTYNDVTFYANLESEKELGKTLSQYKKVFYKNKIETDPQLRSGLNNFFEFMSRDKRGQYKKLDGKTIKEFMNTVSDDVKYLLNDESSGLKRAAKNEVFNAYGDLADNYNKYTQDKVRLNAIQIETDAMAKAGEKTKKQYLKVKDDIKKQNDLLAKTSVEDIAKNKNLLNSVRMSINPNSGEVSYTNYTANDPKGKPELNDLELAKKIKQKASDGNFFVAEHISKKSLQKANTAYPNNLQSANYMSNAQLENARSFLSNSQNRVTEAAQNLDKALEQTGLTIRGPEYGGKPYGNKIDIVFNSDTGRSSIVDNQIFKNVDKFKTSGMSLGAAGDIPMAKEILSKDLEKLKTIFGSKAARQIASNAIAVPGLSALFELPFIPEYQELGYSPKEIATQLLTGGMGVPFKDIQEKGKFVEEKGLGEELQSALRRQMIPQSIRPAMNLPADFGAPQELTPSEKQALEIFGSEAQDVIDARRKIQADEYKRLEEMTDFNDPMFRDAAMNGGIMRLGFADGPEDPGKRKFMKIMGGLASIPILGKFIKPTAKVAPVVIEAAKGVPEWFGSLVNKVIREGTDMTKQFATKEREIVHGTKISDDEYVRVVQDLDEGSIRVEYDSPDNMYGDPVSMQYKKPLPNETTPKPEAEFSVAESGPVGRAYGPDDYEIEIDEIGGNRIEDLDSDVSKLKEYATGKKPTIKEMVKNKKRKDKARAISEGGENEMDAVVRRQGDYVQFDDIDPNMPDD